MAVQVEQERLDPCHVSLTIQVPPEEIQRAIDSSFQQFAKRANIPGFRPGKAPRHLLQKVIDEGRVREMALDRALNNAYRDALKQAGVEPYQYAEPKVDLPEEQIDFDQGFSFKATVALQPQVEVGELEGLSARRVVTTISEEDVTRELDRIREQTAGYEKTDVAADDGDRVRATVEVTSDGEPVPDASFTQPTLIQVGANLESLDAGLKGMTTDEEKTFDFTFPDDFVDEELAGKSATAKVKVYEVWRRTVPEATDELAQKAGFENLEALTTRIRESLQAHADALADQELNEALVREAVKRSTVHFPDEMVEREVSDRMANLMQLLEQRSVTLDDYLAAQEKDLAALEEEMARDARESLTSTLVLIELARQNDVRVTERDVEDEVRRRAEEGGVKLSQMRRELRDSGELDQIRNRVWYRKVAELLRGKAEIREVTG
jgi:trigger factor